MVADSIVVHCSAGRSDDAASIRADHIAPTSRGGRGFSDIGYHYVILNGKRPGHAYAAVHDGVLEPGRPLTEPGAHCKAGGMNGHSVGVCLIGLPGWDGYPHKKQLDRLITLCADLVRKYPDITIERLYQHSQFDPRNKPFCASLDIQWLRRRVAAQLAPASALAVKVNGVPLPVAGVLKGEKAYVPLRAVAEALGMRIEAVTPSEQGTVVTMNGRGRSVLVTCPEHTDDGTSLYPARDLAECLGARISYQARTVSLFAGK